MRINWFPGHMNKAHREIKKVVSSVNLIIEVVDARIPFSSENPLISELRGDKPCIKVLNKSDLADPKITAEWLKHFRSMDGINAVSVTKDKPQQIKNLLATGKKMLPAEKFKDRAVKTMIIGIPNVGKSTLINIMTNRSIAKTGNVPAVTRRQQRIRIGNQFLLYDTPGFLWHKLSHKSGHHLAVTGAIKDSVLEIENIAFYAARHLLDNYPDALKKKYNLETLPDEEMQLMEAIAARRGCIGRGGMVNLEKVCELLIKELRRGALGPFSLERPSDFKSLSDGEEDPVI